MGRWCPGRGCDDGDASECQPMYVFGWLPRLAAEEKNVRENIVGRGANRACVRRMDHGWMTGWLGQILTSPRNASDATAAEGDLRCDAKAEGGGGGGTARRKSRKARAARRRSMLAVTLSSPACYRIRYDEPAPPTPAQHVRGAKGPRPPRGLDSLLLCCTFLFMRPSRVFCLCQRLFSLVHCYVYPPQFMCDVSTVHRGALDEAKVQHMRAKKLAS